MHRHDDAQRRVDVLQLLADEAETDVVHPGAAVLLWHRAAEQAEIGHLRQDIAVEPVLAIEVMDPGRDLARPPFTDGLFEQTVFL